jgi:hypothetical protein
MQHVTVDPRINKRHPHIASDDALAAWHNRIEVARREGWQDDLYVAVGFDNNQRLLEVVAVKTRDDSWHIFHAMRATKKTLQELRMIGRNANDCHD